MANNKVELTFNSGETEIFNDLGLVKYRGKMYAVLQPENLSKHSMGPTDVLIFQTFMNKDGSQAYNIELDDKIVDAVIKKYNSGNTAAGSSAGKAKYNGIGERAVGNPINMLLDVGVMIVLMGLNFFIYSGFPALLLALGMVANTLYFLVHLGAFIIGKR